MIRNKIRRSKLAEQAYTVRRLFAKNDIDMSLMGAGITLLNSLAQAKRSTKERKDYVAK